MNAIDTLNSPPKKKPKPNPVIEEPPAPPVVSFDESIIHLKLTLTNR